MGASKVKHDHNIRTAFRREIGDWRIWWARAVVIAFAAVAGLTVVIFTRLTEQALTLFFDLRTLWWWAPLLWTPLCAAAIVWLTNRWAPGAAGSGIPQVMASLEHTVDAAHRGLFVSLKLTVAKICLTAWGLLAGLSLGRRLLKADRTMTTMPGCDQAASPSRWDRRGRISHARSGRCGRRAR